MPTLPSDMKRQIVELLPRLRRFAVVLTRSGDAADDLVQSAVARALERETQWIEGTRLDRWLFRIIHTVWLNSRRSAAIRQTEVLDDDDGFHAMDGSAAMEARLTLQEVRTAFARLPEDQQQALLLVTVEGYSYRDAAEFLNVPIGTITSRVARGRAALIDSPAETNIIPILRGARR